MSFSLRSTRFVACVTLALLLGWSLAAQAHHGWGGYSDKEFELTGIVSTPLTIAGAHATMKVKSGEQIWNLTLAPPARTTAAGLKEGTIPVGATVVVHGHRHTNPKNFEVKTERITYNGKVFNVYPDRT
jgi:hypothetical protein